MDQKRIIIFTKYLLNFMFYSGILVAVSLPYTLKLAGKYYSSDFAEHYISMLVIFLPIRCLRACHCMAVEKDDNHSLRKKLLCGQQYEKP